MAKKQADSTKTSTVRTLDAHSTASERDSANRSHFQEIATHLIDNSVGHGHMVGSQGPAGHKMPPNDADKQDGAYIPRALMSRLPANRQNTASFEGSGDADDPSVGDYGIADKDA